MVPAFFWNIHTLYQFFQRDDRPARETMARLIDALQINGRQVDSIYVLNSAPSFSAPQYLAGAAGISGRIVLLSEFSGCIADDRGTSAIKQIGVSEIRIAAQLPPCATLDFYGAGPILSQPPIGGIVDRGGFAKYSFPDEKVTGRSLTDEAVQTIDFGRKLNIELEGVDTRKSVLLYYDWATGRYRCLGERCARI
jgi:hypothetical protein